MSLPFDSVAAGGGRLSDAFVCFTETRFMIKHLFPILLMPLALLTACGGGEDHEGATMRPGENCLASGCHSGQFSVAGTVFATPNATASEGLANVTVLVTDANGVVDTLTSNAAGNFYSRAALALPLRSVAVVRDGVRTPMAGRPDGACASCHALGSATGAVAAR